MSKKMAAKARQLLDAHVQFVIEQLESDGFADLAQAAVTQGLKTAKTLKLEEAVSRAAIKETVQIYALKLDLHGAMPELVGDLVRQLYSHRVHEETRLGDLVSDEQFREILDKLLEMHELRERLLQETTANPVYAALAGDILFHGIKGYLSQNRMADSIPGARSMMKLGKTVMSKATPGLEKSLEDGLRKYIHKNIKGTLKESERFLQDVDDEKIRAALLDLWSRLKHERAALFRRYLSQRDAEEFFVLTYDYWRQLRKTDYIRVLIEAGIDGFFDKYGKTDLATLLKEVGIDQSLLVADALRFAPPAIRLLKKKKVLETYIRQALAPFYESAAAQAILAS